MKVKKAESNILEGDMTPMIDMTFQLIAFLMVMINFTADDVSNKLTLPESELARPPEGEPEKNRLIIQLTKDNKVIMGGDELSLDRLKAMLSAEARAFTNQGVLLTDATVYIRADTECRTGKVQEVIKECQAQKFERFVLRAKEKGGN
jgi:biopolymer transport protein ExbD